MVSFTEEILNEKLHFLCSDVKINSISREFINRKGYKPAAGSSIGTSKLPETSPLSLSNNEGIATSFRNNVGDVILVCYAVGKRNPHYLGVT